MNHRFISIFSKMIVDLNDKIKYLQNNHLNNYNSLNERLNLIEKENLVIRQYLTNQLDIYINELEYYKKYIEILKDDFKRN